MQTLSSEQRSEIIENYAKLLLDNKAKIIEANQLDLDLAKKTSKSSEEKSRFLRLLIL